MTSSSDRQPWMPLSLDRVESGRHVRLELAGASALVATASGREGSWLPSFASDAQSAQELGEQEAYRRGREDATKEEHARAEERARTALQAVGRVAAHLETIASEFSRDRERDLQAVALAVARSLVRREFEAAPGILGELVTRAIELMPLDHEIEVRLHPDDLLTLGADADTLTPPGRTVRLQWIADSSVDRGGFLIESPARIIDGRTDVALRVLYERFDHE